MKDFSPEQIEELSKHPDVKQVTKKRIYFTEAFKQRAANLLDQGMTFKDILIESGIDPEVLGNSRINSLKNKIKNHIVHDQSFEDRRKYNGYRQPAGSNPLRRIQELENEVAFLTQEVEFLKKNLEADMEARMFWESQLLQV